jgi:hypothetical protein
MRLRLMQWSSNAEKSIMKFNAQCAWSSSEEMSRSIGRFEMFCLLPEALLGKSHLEHILSDLEIGEGALARDEHYPID